MKKDYFSAHSVSRMSHASGRWKTAPCSCRLYNPKSVYPATWIQDGAQELNGVLPRSLYDGDLHASSSISSEWYYFGLFLSSSTDWSLHYPDVLKKHTVDWPAENRESCCAVCFRIGMELDLTRWFFHLHLTFVSLQSEKKALFQNAIDSNQCNPRNGAVFAPSPLNHQLWI